MDEANLRDHVQKHADAIVSGDKDGLTEDFTAEMRPQLPQLAGSLPQPVTAAEVLSVEPGDPSSFAQIRYTGEGGETTTIRSEWQDEGDRPRIVGGAPVE
jgi:hypothetical protein